MYDNIPATKSTMISFEELGIGSGEMGGFTGIQRYSKSKTSELMDRKAINGLVGLEKTSKITVTGSADFGFIPDNSTT